MQVKTTNRKPAIHLTRKPVQTRKGKYPLGFLEPHGDGLVFRRDPDDPPIQRQLRLLNQAINNRRKRYPDERYVTTLFDEDDNETEHFTFAVGIAVWRVE